MSGAAIPESEALGSVTALLFVNVDDVEAHYARARAAGAEIVTELEDKPYGRTYAAKDPEGHQWHFAMSTGTP
jgi:uncharacterized glyoxalase superfamily protein PhnB